MTKPVVTLREITAETVRTICDLEPHEAQSGFVAPNTPNFRPVDATVRGIDPHSAVGIT